MPVRTDRRSHHPLRTATAIVLGIGLLAACSGGKGGVDAADKVTTTSEAVTPSAPPVAPLTGLPATDAELIKGPALVVKLDNVEPKARPQAGLNAADVVFEERVEGSVTRLLAIFHSTNASPVGPVRSARTSDLGVVNALHHPFFAWSGANDVFAAKIRAAPITDVGFDKATDQYERARDRPAPDNLMLVDSAEIRKETPDEGASAPAPLFSYLSPGQAPTHLEAVGTVTVSYGSKAGSAPVTYTWNGSGWARTQKGSPHVDADGLQVAPANVIIQFVNYASSGVNDQFGVPIPEAQLVGQGDAWVLTAGGLIPAHWSKPSLSEVTTYTDVEGHPVLLTPGRTWVALPEPGAATR